jgi:hypothetical protein
MLASSGMRRGRYAQIGLGVIAVVVALVFSGSAQAANIVPNGSIEGCSPGATPAMWAAFGALNIACESGNPHAGVFSMAVITQFSATGATSDCVSGTFSGMYSREFWWRTASTNIFSLQLRLHFFSSSDCTTGDTTLSLVTSDIPLPWGTTWHHVVGTNVAAPAGTQSFRVDMLVNCSGCGSVTANFDDIVVDGLPPTAVALTSFAATRARGGVVLRWRTAGGVGVAGFDVYRGPLRLNRSLIPAKLSPATATYRFLDRRARDAGFTYRLRIHQLDGTSRWYGPFGVAQRH